MRYAGLILFAALLWTVDWRDVAETLGAADLAWLALAGFVTFGFIIAKGCRWYVILRLQNINYGLGPSLRTYQAGSFCSLITPGKIGDFVKAVYLKEALGVAYPQGIASVGADRIFDLVTMGGAALALLVVFNQAPSHEWSILAFVAMVGFGLFLVFYRPALTLIADAVVRLPGLGRHLENLRGSLRSVYDELAGLKSAAAVIPMLLSAIAYGFLYISAYGLAVSLGLPLSFFEAVYCITVANVVSLLPISFSGIGTRDAAMVVLFADLGLASTQALMFSVGYLLLQIVFGSSLGAWFWFSRPVRLNFKNLKTS